MSLQMNGITGSRKELFSEVEKVLIGKEMHRLLHNEAAKKVNETEVDFVTSVSNGG